MAQQQVKFQPEGIRIKCHAGISVLEAARQAGVIINSPCGGKGTCKKCQVLIDNDQVHSQACQKIIDRDMTVTVPKESRFFEQKILEEGIDQNAIVQPAVYKHYVQLAAASLDDLRSDARRLITTVSQKAKEQRISRIDWRLIQKLPKILADSDCRITAVCRDDRIVGIEPGDTTGTLFGLAVDIGTTSVVATLIDLNNGQTAGTASEINPQVRFGDDIISRIEYTIEKPDGTAQLQRLIVKCINELAEQLTGQVGISTSNIYDVTAAGNATMQHLLAATPVEQIAKAPYVSVFSDELSVPAAELGISANPAAEVYIMPSVAGHVGGDTVAVALAAAMSKSQTVNLAIDIGTNGEIVLGNADRLVCCSAAAGPAFEGARITDGTRGTVGAIERVYINDDVEISVIGSIKPLGICGSGIIDAIAQMLNAGLVDYTGRFVEIDSAHKKMPQALADRLQKQNDQTEFVLAKPNQTAGERAITISQRDIRQVQLAKAAIAAAITILMDRMTITPDEIEHIYLAGAFGNYIRPESAKRIGLLPDIPLEKVLPIGNAAAAGTKLALLNTNLREHAELLGKSIEYLELAGQADFQTMFSDNMLLPEK